MQLHNNILGYRFLKRKAIIDEHDAGIWPREFVWKVIQMDSNGIKFSHCLSKIFSQAKPNDFFASLFEVALPIRRF